ncbi:hypothetical protein HOY82DRAFT_544267 [Tuber indicum]|nr:hypothetical protein HOY82DRAFT_544267 [Tuber indicum]
MPRERDILRKSNLNSRISKTTQGRQTIIEQNIQNSRRRAAATSHQPPSSSTNNDDHSTRPLYFQGLNLNQGKALMESIQHEYQEFLQSLNNNASGSNGSDQHEVPTDIEMVEDITPGEEDDYTNSMPNRKQQEYQEYRIKWGKKNWSHIFERFDKYEGDSTLTVAAWSNLLEWFSSTLSKTHMSNLQVQQQELIRTYSKIIRLENLEDLTLINRRVWLITLYESHTSYSDMIRGSGKTLQQRQQQVNKFIHHIFNSEMKIEVTMQTIKNHVKEGRHLHEMLFAAETRTFGYGLLFLLPVHGYKEIARKTSHPVWSFLIQQIPRMSRRVTELAKAFDPIMKAIQQQGTSSVMVSLLGYELTIPIDLDSAAGTDFNACVRSYPNLHLIETLKSIQRYGRLKEPHSIEKTFGKRREGHQRARQGSELAAGNDSQERTEEGEWQDKLTSSDDNEEQTTTTEDVEDQSSSAGEGEDESTSAEEDKDQSTSEEEDGEQSTTEDEEEERLTANKGKEVQSFTATSTNATNTRVELKEIGISIVLQDGSANNASNNETVSDRVDGGSKILHTNPAEEQVNDNEENLPPAIDGENMMVVLDFEEHQNQAKTVRDPDIEVFASIEVDESFAGNIQQIERSLEHTIGRVSETQMTRIEEKIPEMSEIIERSWNDLVEDMVENDEDIMKDL